MNLKKIFLIALLVLSITALVLIVLAAKFKVGIFGKLYDNYVNQKVTDTGLIFKKNMDQINLEVKQLSKEGVMVSVFVSSSLGEGVDKHLSAVEKFRSAIIHCDKIQLIDRKGKVVFSTVVEELPTQKRLHQIKPVVLEKIEEHFKTQNEVYYYVINTNQFVSLYPVTLNPEKPNDAGFVAVYFNSARLMEGINKGSMSSPFSFDDFIFLSDNEITRDDMNKIANYYKVYKTLEAKGDYTFGAYSEINGIKYIYYSKTENFIPPQIIVFILIPLLLLGTVLFALNRTIAEEKINREAYNLYNKPSQSPAYSRSEEIGDLVEDIEEDRPYQESYASKSIEEMIMTNDMDLTATPEEMYHEEVVHNFEEPASQLEEDLAWEESGAKFSGDFESPELEKTDLESNYLIISDEDKGILSDMASAPSEGEDADSMFSHDVYNTRIEPSAATSMFAEHDRIMSGVGNIDEVDLDITTDTPAEPSDFELIPDTGTLPSFEPVDGPVEIDEPVFEEPMLSTSLEEEFEAIDISDTVPQTDDQFDEIASLSLDTDDLNIDMAGIEDDIIIADEETLGISYPEAPEQVSPPEEKVNEPIDFKKVFTEPPVIMNAISTIDDYIHAVLDLSRENEMDSIYILKREGKNFKPLQREGISYSDSLMIHESDKIYKKIISRHKSLNIKGNLDKTHYLTEKFSPKELENLDEFYIVPIIKHDIVEGIAFFGRGKGKPDVPNNQKYELFNLGFLQEV